MGPAAAAEREIAGEYRIVEFAVAVLKWVLAVEVAFVERDGCAEDSNLASEA